MAYTRPWPVPPSDVTTLYHLSDSHIGYSSPYDQSPVGWDYTKSTAMLADIDSALVRGVDGVVHTGDITDDGGGPSSTEQGQDEFALDWLPQLYPGVPSAWCIGNHDIWDRPSASRAEWESVYGRSANGAVDMGHVRVLHFAPDAHRRGDEWTIPPETLAWLDTAVQGSDRPVILVNHFPLFELGGGGPKPTAPITALIADNPKVIAHLCGHQHYTVTDTRTVSLLTFGARKVMHVCGPSVGMSGAGGVGYAGLGSAPMWALYVSVLSDTRFDIRYRRHSAHAWDGPNRWRVQAVDAAAGTITSTMGAG